MTIFSEFLFFAFVISRFFSGRYLGHTQTFKAESFATIIHSQNPLTVSAKPSIVDVCGDPMPLLLLAL